jgi:cobalt-zinc-cadmium efflux system outer membrane protein
MKPAAPSLPWCSTPQRQLRRARTELVKARGDQQMRLAEIEKMVGEDL